MPEPSSSISSMIPSRSSSVNLLSNSEMISRSWPVVMKPYRKMSCGKFWVNLHSKTFILLLLFKPMCHILFVHSFTRLQYVLKDYPQGKLMHYNALQCSRRLRKRNVAISHSICCCLSQCATSCSSCLCMCLQQNKNCLFEEGTLLTTYNQGKLFLNAP